MRLLFMGSPLEVVAPLEYLLEHGPNEGLQVIGVVSQPSRAAGRGGKLTQPPVAAFAEEKKLPLFQPLKASSEEFLQQLQELKPDVIITAAYGQILSEKFLQVPNVTINIHPSLLPLYRGATPVQSALYDGQTTTGVTILKTVRKLDAGPIFLQRPFAILPEETAGTLMVRLFRESGPMLVEVLKQLKKELSLPGSEQDESKVTLCRKFAKEDGKVDWSLHAKEVLCRFRAFHPWPGSFSFFQGKRVVFHEMALAARDLSAEVGGFSFDKQSSALLVATTQGTLHIRRLQLEGNKAVDAVAFWNGLKQREGLRFG